MNGDRLDSAIDQVTAKMVAVPDDPEMVTRIVSSLPERSSWFGRLIPQFAALSALVVVAVVWSMRERPTVPALLPSTDVAAVAPFRGVAIAREPGTPREPGTAVRPQPLEPWNPGTLEPDFDRSLPALDALDALELAVIGPHALATAEALTLAPLEIGELPLTAETVSPDKF